MQAILCQWVVAVIRLVGYPVVRQLFVAKHQHAQVAVFVIFDDRQRGKGLAQTNAVCQNAAIELLQLADDGKGGILLEGVQLVPDDAFLKVSLGRSSSLTCSKKSPKILYSAKK